MGTISRLFKPCQALGRRTIFTSSPRMDNVFREVRDLGFAPKFKDEFVKRNMSLPVLDMGVWMKYDKVVGYMLMCVILYTKYKMEYQKLQFEDRIIFEAAFRNEDIETIDKYEKMFGKYIDEVWEKNGVL